ncbi:MAG: phospholipase [Amycolatopsis sp.]|jgi:phospholipase/carboxylesterase|uniref:alpha/beta hydrolase n=1 Tax=Amycolatopsis sp. TaxID=37632 RepID=UPI00262089BE|nr:dienelactone hydrolase family protein [Amycolatopsis sp.]MCU1683014.1 phospholipase [Amycolatopsis sp.]
MGITAKPGMNRDAVLWSAVANERGNRPVLVMLHGWSYDETHLYRRLASHLPEELVVASVRARIPEAGGYAWFPSAGNPIGNPQPRVANAATEDVLAWTRTLDAPSIGLLGFSQGGAMVHQLMRRAPGLFAYGVSLAGFVVADQQPGDATLAKTRPPVYSGRGENDWVIPDTAVDRTERWLKEHATAETQVYSGLDHDVAGQEIDDLAGFVAKQLHQER